MVGSRSSALMEAGGIAGEKRLRIGVAARMEDGVDAAGLDDLARIHHIDPVAELGDDARDGAKRR